MCPDNFIEFRVGKATKIKISKEGRITLWNKVCICFEILRRRQK